MAKATNYDMMKRIEALENKSKSIITAGITSNFTLEIAGTNTVPINKEICKKGSAFSIKNGKIYVDTDISYVKISANAVINAKARTGSALNLMIYKNGEEEAVAMSTTSESGVTNQVRSISAKLVDVQKNDFFEMKVYAQPNEFVMFQDQRTYITIEEV